ncbi:MAG: DedA family protein [Nanoarchaeota archaeon]|nr:DedA family protein [Nanoarchaeota archaeon]
MFSEFFNGFVVFLTNTIGAWGYLGILILMIVESSFIPFPSEVVLIPAGILIANGEMSWLPVITMAIMGSIIGALINYYIALSLGRRLTNRLVSRYGKIFMVNKDTILKSEKYFDSHGEITILAGRLIPGIRQIISLPAGFSRMNIFKFILFTTIGALIWSGFLTYAGYLIGANLSSQEPNLKMLSLIGIIIAIALIGSYVMFRKKIQNTGFNKLDRM